MKNIIGYMTAKNAVNVGKSGIYNMIGMDADVQIASK
jgi:hypothetical protein